MPPALENPLVLWFVLSAALAGLAYAFVREELRARAILYGAFLIACGVALWPPHETLAGPGKIKLGLDLRGGIHLVLQVVVDDALNATVDDAVQTAREQAGKKGVVIGGAQRVSPTSFSVEGVEPARVKDMRDILKDYFRTDWELREPTEGKFLLEMTEPYQARLKERTVEEAIKTLERRVNQLGVAEPVIAKHGNRGDQILIQLPGVTDPEAAKRVIKTTAQLALKLVEGEPSGSREALLQAFGGRVPDHLEVVSGQGDQPGQPMFYLVRREAVITGRDLKSARAGIDPQTNAPDVQFSLNPQGADKFKRETGKNVGRRLAIVLDGSVASAPTIQSQISDSGVITGRFTSQEADELAKVLRAGALPATLKYLQELTVGPSLGRDSIRAGVLAAAASMAFITAFMLFYYRLSGLNAVVALAANVLILLGAMAYAGATLTLPGFAGIILTVGVGVDTNVLVFERIREELRNGKTVRAAVQNGFDRVWVTIIDTHATALIAAAFLFTFGTGPIKGFAVTLVWGLIANIFASYFVSRFLFEWVLGKRNVESLSIGRDFIKNPNFDFLGKAKYFLPLSLALMVAGLYMGLTGLRYGVEFSGGTQVIAKFKDAPQVDKIRDAVEQVSPGSVIQSYGETAAHQVLIRLAAVGEGAGPGGELDTTAKKVLDALGSHYTDNPVLEHSSEIVGPVVGAELRRKAIWLTVFGLLFQLLYIAARFKGGIWGVAAVLACFHDVLVCVAFLGFFGYEITLNVIAALLTLVGYSVNDTIVIFDRVRENLKQRRKDSMAKILNDSINQTLTRTLISNGTTFLAVLGLFLFGGEVLAGFGFTMAVGILVGTYSTIYIAGPLVAWWSERTERGGRAVQSAKAAL